MSFSFCCTPHTRRHLRDYFALHIIQDETEGKINAFAVFLIVVAVFVFGLTPAIGSSFGCTAAAVATAR